MVYKYDVMWKFQNYVKERSIIFVICTRSNIYKKKRNNMIKFITYQLCLKLRKIYGK